MECTWLRRTGSRHWEEKGDNAGSTDHLKSGKVILEKSPKTVCPDQGEETRNPSWDTEEKKEQVLRKIVWGLRIQATNLVLCTAHAKYIFIEWMGTMDGLMEVDI